MANSDEWVISGTIAEARSSSGYGSSESWGLVMAGGYNGGSSSSRVETTYNGKKFGILPDLEVESHRSCVVVIDEENIFTCGGYLTSATDTFIFSNSTNIWSRYTPN